MQDRIPLYPGRVTMTPVAGQANTFDMVRADDPTQAGTPLNKATLLKDATAALYGLGTGAVPDDVLAELGKYKQYWWSAYSDASWDEYIEEQSDSPGSSSDPTSGVVIVSDSHKTIQLSKEIAINQTSGTVTLKNPQTIQFASNLNNVGTVLQPYIPCYISNLAGGDASAVYYFPDGALVKDADISKLAITDYYRGDDNEYYYVGLTPTAYMSSGAVSAKKITSRKITHTGVSTTYVYSGDRNAYPDSGTVNGITYTYLGIPFDNAVTASKIATGSYVGTGTYGINNPNSLTFDFEPKIVLIKPSTNGTLSKYWMCFTNGLGTSGGGLVWGSESYTFGYKVSYSFYGNTVQWYTTDVRSTPQANDADTTYGYIAIG